MKRRTITVYMSDGDTITTEINGTDEEIVRHYLGNRFEAGSDTEHHVALSVHFHDTDRRFGLRFRNIESGSSGYVADVRRRTVKVDDTESFDEVLVTTRVGTVYALNDVWVYGLDGQWLGFAGVWFAETPVGYPHATV
jgi:hypothetical protein